MHSRAPEKRPYLPRGHSYTQQHMFMMHCNGKLTRQRSLPESGWYWPGMQAAHVDELVRGAAVPACMNHSDSGVCNGRDRLTRQGSQPMEAGFELNVPFGLKKRRN